MLEIPLELNEVPDLITEDGDILPENMRPNKGRRDEIFRGQRKQRKEDDIHAEKREHSQLCLRGYNILRDSILKIGIKTNKKKMSGRHQTSFRRFQRWYFATES